MDTMNVVLPCQLLTQRGRTVAEPQRRLMLAVLQTVVDDVTAGATGRATVLCDARAYQQALAYVDSRDRHWPFSFENICETIGLDADSVRQTLQRQSGVLQRRSA
jgi:hypothetical protein